MESLKNLDRMGEKSAKNLLEGIEKSKSRELPKFLNALSIRNVGNRTATLLARHFGSVEKLRQASETEISDIDEIGPVIAKSVFEFFQREKEMIDALSAVVCRLPLTVSSTQSEDCGSDNRSVLHDMTIVVTGTLERFKRKEIEGVIEQHGGRVSSSVSSKTSFVLVGAEPGSKLDKAQKLGVRIADEQEFLEMIGVK
jgi:DNA ligase (NAD+)